MAAAHLGTTKETIRNWERNGLLDKNFSAYQKRIYEAKDIERMKIIYMLLQTGYSIMAIRKYFLALTQNNQDALQVLIDPVKDEDLFSIQDRWLQTLKAARTDSLEMLELVSEKDKPYDYTPL